jgi:hypothetical protein
MSMGVSSKELFKRGKRWWSWLITALAAGWAYVVAVTWPGRLELVRTLIIGWWAWISPVARMMRYTRIPTLSAVIGFAGFNLTAQGEEISFALLGPDQTTITGIFWWVAKSLLALLFLFMWAVNCGLWARLIIQKENDTAKNADFGSQRVWNWLTGHWPKILTASCFASVAFMLVRTAMRVDLIDMWLLAALAVCSAATLFPLLLIFEVVRARAPRSGFFYLLFHKPSLAMRSAFVVLSWAVFVIFLVLLAISRGLIGMHLGSPMIIFAFLASVTGILGHLAELAHERRIPVLTGLIVLSVL